MTWTSYWMSVEVIKARKGWHITSTHLARRIPYAVTGCTCLAIDNTVYGRASALRMPVDTEACIRS
jgi:hypothetical protein